MTTDHTHDHTHTAEGCDEALASLYHFLDGELDDVRRDEIAKHLDDCSPCLEAFDFEAELRIVIAAKCTDTVPASLRSRLLSLFDEQAPQPAGDDGA